MKKKIDGYLNKRQKAIIKHGSKILGLCTITFAFMGVTTEIGQIVNVVFKNKMATNGSTVNQLINLLGIVEQGLGLGFCLLSERCKEYSESLIEDQTLRYIKALETENLIEEDRYRRNLKDCGFSVGTGGLHKPVFGKKVLTSRKVFDDYIDEKVDEYIQAAKRGDEKTKSEIDHIVTKNPYYCVAFTLNPEMEEFRKSQRSR